MNLFEYKKIGPKPLQICEIERKMASLLMQKFEYTKNIHQQPHI